MIYYLIRTLVKLMSYIPFSMGQFFGKTLGTVISMIPMHRNTVSIDNIRRSFGNSMGHAELKRLNRRVIEHFSRMFFEVPHILRLNHKNLDRYVVFADEEKLHEAIEEGNGVFILTGHFGNWELLSAALSIRFGPGAVVARPIDFYPIDQLMYELRSRFGTEVLPKKRSIRRIMKAIKEKKVVGILLDQNVDWYEGVFVNFLGRWACTNKGLALMALKTDAPVIPAFSVRRRDGRYLIILENEVALIRTGDRTIDVEENTALFTGIIEKYIRKYPDHWFWFHNRWKTWAYCPLPDSFLSHSIQKNPGGADHCAV
ncbi:MAG: lysophospholipid acyltransferase family protein [Thermodesulfobacteriota bacterium]|nr:lysophospholipid acyltransferase family protein [Thermodesulfobacteriota bacterium]